MTIISDHPTGTRLREMELTARCAFAYRRNPAGSPPLARRATSPRSGEA